MRTFTLSLLLFCPALFAQAQSDTASTNAYFEQIKKNPALLHAFLYRMPKGGDLHMHESGSAFAENLLEYAKNDALCIDRTNFTVSFNDTCAPSDMLQTAIQDPDFKNLLIDKWSMRHFDRQGTESGHDHFFGVFGKYSAISWAHRGEILAEITQRAAKQNISYLEIMLTPDRNAARILGQQLGFDPNFTNMRDKLIAAGMPDIVKNISLSLDADTKEQRSRLHCDNKPKHDGCQVNVRYIYQVGREQAPEMVFAQLLAGFESAHRDPRIVAVNLVQPEDGPLSMRDYQLHMQMIAFLRTYYPRVPVSLHAGELNDTLVPEAGLQFHIQEALTVAGAERIGHGVDITHETNFEQTLEFMRNQHVMVEINLGSNDYILNTRGLDHPLHRYLDAGVPVALSTDDEGVSRENLTLQFERAVRDNDLPYATLKQMVRNSLFFAFVPGENLWTDSQYTDFNPVCENDNPANANTTPLCKTFLEKNEKARLQWVLEKQWAQFEHTRYIQKKPISHTLP